MICAIPSHVSGACLGHTHFINGNKTRIDYPFTNTKEMQFGEHVVCLILINPYQKSIGLCQFTLKDTHFVILLKHLSKVTQYMAKYMKDLFLVCQCKAKKRFFWVQGELHQLIFF